MIVDDDADIRGALSDLFSDHGYRSLLARNGQDALDILAGLDQRPCIMLLDLIMPELDGFALLARRHGDPLLEGIAMVAMSASPQNLDREELRFADQVCSKPLDVDVVLQLVKECCARVRPNASLPPT